ncbi:MAG: nucleotidyltransferase domain-containing protein [Candidatus Aminicenantes bacterium]|nr:nucleotidyltransferase domain-containing protein [Candidatus Aminicenantes bacterium]
MAEKKDGVKEILKRLLKTLQENRIPISEAYLFGSYAYGHNTEYSDIDVALISEEFTGVRYYDVKKISRLVRNIDFRIEVHPFALSDKGESLFLDEIIRTGIRVA